MFALSTERSGSDERVIPEARSPDGDSQEKKVKFSEVALLSFKLCALAVSSIE
jgi:hypothetical protein